jgi:hypothetical protein
MAFKQKIPTGNRSRTITGDPISGTKKMAAQFSLDLNSENPLKAQAALFQRRREPIELFSFEVLLPVPNGADGLSGIDAGHDLLGLFVIAHQCHHSLGGQDRAVVCHELRIHALRNAVGHLGCGGTERKSAEFQGALQDILSHRWIGIRRSLNNLEKKES